MSDKGEQDSGRIRFTWFIIGALAGGLLAHVSWLIGLSRLAAKGLLCP
jgi:hypothetical protein